MSLFRHVVAEFMGIVCHIGKEIVMKRRTLPILAVICLVCSCSKQNHVQRLLAAVAANDFDTIFSMDAELQRGLAKIRSESPQFMQEKKLREFIDGSKAAFLIRGEPSHAGATFYQYVKLDELLAFKPAIQLIECRSGDAYVKFTFKSFENSPLASGGYSCGMGKDFSAQFLKEVVVLLEFDESGRYFDCKRVPDTEIFWEDLPLKIIGVDLDGTPHDFDFYCMTTGQKPAKVTIKIGDYTIPGKMVSLSYREHTSYVRLYDMAENLPLESARNIPVSVSVVGTNGQRDDAVFTMPRFNMNDSQNYIRTPWYRTCRTWRGMRELRDAQ